MSAPVEHQIATADGSVPGLLWLPEGASADAPVPGLVVVQEIFGLSEFVRSRCADLADLGYAVLAPAVYSRIAGKKGKVRLDDVAVVEPDTDNFLRRAMGLVGHVDWAQAVRDGLAARDALASMPEVVGTQVGLVGFCFGGGLAFNVAARAAQAGVPVAALVSYYGSALPDLLDLAPDVDCPSLHHFGTSDAYISMAKVGRIREAVTAGGTREQVRLELHEGAGHAFDNPHEMFHHAQASRDAWAQTEQFLVEVLPTRSESGGPPA